MLITVIILITVITIISTKTVFAHTIGPAEMTVSYYGPALRTRRVNRRNPLPVSSPAHSAYLDILCPTCTVSVQNPGLYRSTHATRKRANLSLLPPSEHIGW